MLKEYRTIYNSGQGEIIEKKSRFIAIVESIENEEQAIAFIEMMRKKNWNATHNCYAYVVGEDNPIQRCSDDGEPGGTAGKPMLDVLIGEGIHNVVVVVTRYYGGTLLGTGGLVRAYSSAVKEGLHKSDLITKYRGQLLSISTDYTGFGKIQYILGQRGLTTIETKYTEVVEMQVIIKIDESNSIKKEIIEQTNGKAIVQEKGDYYFAKIEGELIVF